MIIFDVFIISISIIFVFFIYIILIVFGNIISIIDRIITCKGESVCNY